MRHRRYARTPRNVKLLKILRREAYQEQHGRCFWCGSEMLWEGPWNHPRTCTADHLIHRSRGGHTVRGNIVAACRECNNKRHPGPLVPVGVSEHGEA